MAKQKETRLKERVLRDLKLLPRSWPVKIQQVSIRGTPDILACLNGFFVALELKQSPKAKVAEIQIYTLAQIAAAGGFAAIVTPENWAEVYQFMLQHCGMLQLEEKCSNSNTNNSMTPNSSKH